MERISSPRTRFYKWTLPIMWSVLLLAMIGNTFFGGAARQDPFFVVMPIFMMVVGVVVFRKAFWILADEVDEGRDFLLVRRRGVEERVALLNVMNVETSRSSNPKRVILRLRKPGAWGDEIAFLPKDPFPVFDLFARSETAERLIRKIDNLRSVQ